MEGETAGYKGQTAALLGAGHRDGADVAGGVPPGSAPNQSLIGSIMALLELDLAVPDHTTLSRRAETLHVPRLRHRHHAEPLHLLVNSTGLQLCGANELLEEKHGTNTRRDWRTLHFGTDADTGEIVAATLTHSEICDASQVGPVLKAAPYSAEFVARYLRLGMW